MEFRIRPDQRGWIVEKQGAPMGPKAKTPGAPTWTDQRFHANLEQAAVACLDRVVHDGASPEPELVELVSAISAAVGEVKAAVKEAASP